MRLRFDFVCGTGWASMADLLVFQSVVPHIAVLSLSLCLFLFILIIVFGDDVEMHGMDLHHFELGFAFRAIQDLTLFHFILVDINLDGAFRAAHHSRTSWPS